MTSPRLLAVMRAAARSAQRARSVVTPEIVTVADAVATTVVAADAPALAVHGVVSGTVVAASGSLNVRLEGTNVVNSMRYAHAATLPSDASVDSGTLVNARATDLVGLTTLAFGGDYYVKARFFTGSGGAGDASGYIVQRFFRDTPGVLTRYLKYAGGVLAPDKNGQAYWRWVPAFTWGGGTYPANDGSVWAANGAGTATGISPQLPLPNGATITKLEASVMAVASADEASVALYKASDGSVIASLATGASTGTAIALASGALSEAVTSASGYVLRGASTNDSADGNSAIWSITVTYTVPDQSVGI